MKRNLFISLILTEWLHGTSCCVQEKQRGNCSASHSIWSKCSPEKHCTFLKLLSVSSFPALVLGKWSVVLRFLFPLPLLHFNCFCFWTYSVYSETNLVALMSFLCSFVAPPLPLLYGLVWFQVVPEPRSSAQWASALITMLLPHSSSVGFSLKRVSDSLWVMFIRYLQFIGYLFAKT